MHYFIDGYNLLFRLLHDQNNLQNQRETIIHELNKKISLIKIDVSIVFDSAFQLGNSSRTHFKDLEIVYTAERETADDYILDELKNSLHPHQEKVVTSDKTFARKARNLGAKTHTVEEFILWLNRTYKNKLRQPKKEKKVKIPLPLKKSKVLHPSPLIPPKDAPLEAYTDYYEKIFESEWQKILENEKKSSSKTQSKGEIPLPKLQ